jgi:hypothetical protein
MKINIECEIPQIILTKDYHEFDQIEDCINLITTYDLIKVKEIGFSRGSYVGLIYIATQYPTDEEIKNMLTNKGVVFDENFY